MSRENIVWDVSDVRGELPHKDLIETFVEKYIFEQKQIFPEPNPFLLKIDIRDGKYLTGNYSDIISSFERMVLNAQDPLSAKAAPLNHLYNIDILGDFAERERNVGKITMLQIYANEELKQLQKDSVWFTPERHTSNGNGVLYRDKNATRVVQLIYDPDLGYNDNLPLENFFVHDKQVFIPETGNILLVK